MIVAARIYGKEGQILIDSGTTRRFVTPVCCTIGLDRCHPMMQSQNWAIMKKTLSRKLIKSTTITVAGLVKKVNLTNFKNAA